jgi:uncharacterized protein YkwD
MSLSRLLATITIAALFLGSAFLGTAKALNGTEGKLLRAVNALRAANGLRPLHVDRALEDAARAHSFDMLGHGYFDHGDFARRMQTYHARGRFLGENIAWGAGNLAGVRTVIRMWLESPEHRANLLRPGYRRVGIGVAAGNFEGMSNAMVVTADFAGR